MLLDFLRRYERVWRFLLVGGAMTLLYSALTAGLILGRLVEDRTLASLCASFATIPLSFLIHRRVTYRDTRYQRSQWLRFGVIALTNLAINMGAMKGSEMLHRPFWAALIVGWVLVPVVNYLLNAIWVFRTRTLLSLDRPEP